MTDQELHEHIKESGLRPVDLVKISEGRIGKSQASQMIRFHEIGKNLSGVSKALLYLAGCWVAMERDSQERTDVPEVPEVLEGTIYQAELATAEFKISPGVYMKKHSLWFFNYEGVLYYVKLPGVVGAYTVSLSGKEPIHVSIDTSTSMGSFVIL